MTTPKESRVMLNRRNWRVLALSLLIAIVPAAKAADGDRDPPTRAARVVNVVGDAWLFDHDSREWTPLTRNQTLGEGDRVRTDDRARVSMRVGSTTVWLDERSDVELSQLDDGQTLLQIDRGDVALRLRSPENAAETRLRTREGTAQPEREGLYRVEQLDRGSKVYVWQGRLRFDWQRGAAPVVLGDGEQAEMWWPDGPRAERSRLYSDGFGDWVQAESRLEGDATVARYVSPEMTGAEDLNRYGRWETAPDYGPVWIPTALVVADWAPYRYGHWAWSRNWGWAWVDDAPWGFAPFHYGRWVNWNGRWCWTPGAYVRRPAYAPALVGWVGGPSVGVSITIGGGRPPPPRVGWYPLAPREVFVPGYRHSPGYVNRVNDPRDVRDPVTVNRPNRYRDVPMAVSVLPSAGGGRPVPARNEGGWDRGQARPLPTAPGRGELAGAQPARPVTRPENEAPRPQVRQPEPQMGWRSDNLPVRRDRGERERDRAETATPGMMPGQAHVPQPAAQMPVSPAAPAVQQPQVRNPQAELPRVQRDERRDDGRRDDLQQRREERREELRREEQPQRRAMPMPERQVEQQRQPERQIEVQRPQPQRMPESRPQMPEVPRVQPQPQPQQVQQPQPQPQVQHPQQQPRNEERGGPQRGRQDGPQRERGNRENERER